MLCILNSLCSIHWKLRPCTVNIQGEIIQRQHHQAFQFSEDLGAGVTLEMVAIPGGMFSMGSHGHMGYEDEHPQHLVTLKSFYIGRFAVTQQQLAGRHEQTIALPLPG